MSLFLEIVTPDSIAFAKEVKGVVIPTANGRIHILPHHIPIIDRVVPGYVKVSLQGEDDYFSINRGFVEVYGEKVSIITDGASKAKEEDEAAAKIQAMYRGKADRQKLEEENADYKELREKQRKKKKRKKKKVKNKKSISQKREI